MDLRGKKIIVTGGARGLGRAMVDAFLSRESNVTIFDLAPGGVVCDVTDPEQVSNAIDDYANTHGAPDVLVNNAGILHSELLVKLSESGLRKHQIETWDRVIRTNLNSVFYVTSCVVEKMIATRTKGVVVNIGSVSAAGNPGASAYSAAKAGVHSITQAWARELGPMGIRVVAVAPGFMDTESASAAMSERALQETIKRVPLRRLGRPEEVAAAIVSVVENDFFNGKVFELDGGLII